MDNMNTNTTLSTDNLTVNQNIEALSPNDTPQRVNENQLTKIFVNGTPHEVKGKKVSYNQIVALWGQVPISPEVNTIISVVYEMGPKLQPEGKLLPGENVQIIEGMKLNCELIQHGDGNVLNKIFVNGTPHDVKGKKVSYNQIVALWGQVPISPDGGTTISVVYEKGPKSQPEGKLLPGEHVLIIEGMEFDADLTPNS